MLLRHLAEVLIVLRRINAVEATLVLLVIRVENCDRVIVGDANDLATQF